MDGIHDLGGKQGFGAIDVNEPEEAFHQPLDGIGWTINQTTRAPGLSIDWWRFIRENTPPIDYLSRPYFDQWAMTQLIALIDNEQILLDDVLTGRTEPPVSPARTMSKDDVYQATAMAATRFDRATQKKARYSPGDEVTTRDYSVPGHTRLPAYARAKRGNVIAHHGAHLFPDDCARGIENEEHLYTVRFSAHELWPADDKQNNAVYLDLWEPYFIREDR